MLQRLKRKEPGDVQRESSTKRQRVSRACDQCRAAREKCDGVQPACSTCVSANRGCSYTIPPKKRGIQPGYIRTLELTLGWVFESTPKAESKLHTALTQDAVASILTGKDEEASSRLHKAWRRSGPCRELERLLGTVRTEPDHDASSTAGDALQKPRATSDAIRPLDSSRREAPQRTSLPHNCWRLLDIYFAYTHNWLPIVQKHEILRLTYAYGAEGLDLDERCDADHAELWAMLAVAAPQDEADSDTSAAMKQSPRIYDTARSLIPHERIQKSAGHVRASLLLALVNVGAGDWAAVWLLLGQAISIATDLQLDNPSSANTNRNKHTVLACFLLEVLVCGYLGREPRLSSTEIAALGPVAEEGLEEWNPWADCEGFGAGDAAKDPSTRPPARVPTHSMSILNKMVLLSNSMRTSAMPPLHNLPEHLRNPGPSQSTPQLLQLHILHACCVMDTRRCEHLMSEHRRLFGSAALPATFRLYALTAIQRSASVIAGRILTSLKTIDCMIAKVYDATGADEDGVESQVTVAHQARLHDDRVEHRGLDSATDFPSWDDMAPLDLQNPGTSAPADFTRRSGLSPSVAGTADDSNSLQRFPSNTIDVDALFDELASLDNADQASHHPMFMQNLGFVPNTDINDILEFDLGFDPRRGSLNGALAASNTSFDVPG